MRTPAGVVAAAVVLALMTAMGLLGSLASAAISLLAARGTGEPMIPAVRVAMIVTALVMLAVFLFCGWTAVGLFRLRRWARYSILAIGGLEFFATAMMGLVMILMRNAVPPPPSGPEYISMPAMMVGMGAFYGVLSLIGVWWLAYFNLAHVRAAFAGEASPAPMPRTLSLESTAPIPAASAPPPPVSGWRIVIVVWACLALLSCLFFPAALAMHLPMFLFGVVLRGTTAAAVVLVMLAIQLFLGVGLLRKWRAAWYAALLWQAYTLAYFVAMALPGMPARFAAYQQELMGRWDVALTTPDRTWAVAMPEMHAVAALSMVVGAAIVVVLTMALVRQRGDYLRAG